MPSQQLRRDLFSHDRKNFFLLAGPCVVESRSLAMEVASEIKRINLQDKQEAGHSLSVRWHVLVWQ